MGTYDTQAAKIKRQRAIADALRASGNESLPASLQTGGRFDAPVSGWQYANKALAQVLGAYQGVKADRDQKKLDQQDAAELENVVAAKRLADTQADAAPAQAGDDLSEVTPLPKIDGKAALQAAALRGQQYGGQAGDVSGEFLKRELFPAEAKEHVLGYGDTLYDKNNRPVASGADRPVTPSADDRALVNIVDPKAKNGYRTIRRSDFKDGDQEYQKPLAGAVLAGSLTDDAKDRAAEFFRLNHTLPAGMGRSPQTAIAIMNRAAELSAAAGDDRNAGAIRQMVGKAGQQALGQLSKQQTMVGAFEKTARSNGKLAVDLSNKVERETNVPIFDSWVNAGRKKLTGTSPLAKFSAANDTFVSEYAKVMSGSMGNTPTSDAARDHANQLIGTAMTADTYAGVMDTLNQEMNNRTKGFSDQASQLFSQMSGTGELSGATPEDAPATTPPVAPAAPPVTKVIGGKTYVKTGPGPNDWEAQ